jgi:hypothetical protein
MRGSGFYWAYWILTRPVGWVFRLVFGAVRALFLFTLPPGGLHFRPLTGTDFALRLVVAANLAVTAISVVTTSGAHPAWLGIRGYDPLGLVRHPVGWLVGAFVVFALYILAEDFGWRDTFMALFGLGIAVLQLCLTAGPGWILVALGLTLLMFLVLRMLASNVPLVGKFGIVLGMLLAYQAVRAVAAG